MGVDKLLAERAVRGDPVRVAMAGCGFMGRGLVNLIVNCDGGMTLAAIAVRSPDKAFKALIDAGVGDAIAAEGAPAPKQAIRQGVTAVTGDFHAITQTGGVDVVIDVTGAVEFGCHLARDCVAGRKHLVLMNAELDATVGAELGRLADAAGVVLTGCDGDQPGARLIVTTSTNYAPSAAPSTMWCTPNQIRKSIASGHMMIRSNSTTSNCTSREQARCTASTSRIASAISKSR
ncbi:hypothetical protein M5I08_07665 [Candidatus Mycobacterium methanotrophicum]|uniref:Aspartate/homoserine dehydrogenase NAD-binding domain-containing protein n=1 Tax=Candidatus Mycobacterium methanotrophicum TaxID=2943498 RepID=A0ABY4QMR4_9MYCO|nr:hypothetical protein [Candidatus Mycobacterium methanotrophicum]UQX12164.1 hypothetical protein M5I08_07665 [Candidatus Mycobacterium methanotrophicum]